MSALEEIDCEKPTFKFEAGEKVLCFHGPLIYESKCQQVRICEDTRKPEYLIHYFGWNKNWDEWVAESRILKFNETNVKKQQELERALSKVKERRRVKRKGASTESKESKNSDSSSNQSSCSNSVTEEISQPRVVIERHLTNYECTLEKTIKVEGEEELQIVITNDVNYSSCSNIKVKQEDDSIDESCRVDLKIENKFITESSEGNETSEDKESNRISQRRSSRLSVESRTSSQDQEIIKKEEKVIPNELENCAEEHLENKNELKIISHTQLKLINYPIGGEELENPVDAPPRIDRRRSSAMSENGTCALENGLDKPKRRFSVDTRKSTTEETQHKFFASFKEKVAQKKMIIDAKKYIETRPANLVFMQCDKKLFKCPGVLRTHLIDDWDLICRQHKLCCLPAEYTVEKIIKTFISCCSMHGGLEKEKIIEFMNLLRSYFDISLGNRLLHKFERSQYSNIMKLHPFKKMSEIYGGPHLLRLMFALEETHWYDIEKADYDVFGKIMQLFIKFLVLKANVYFSAHVYYFATIDYHREDCL